MIVWIKLRQVEARWQTETNKLICTKKRLIWGTLLSVLIDYEFNSHRLSLIKGSDINTNITYVLFIKESHTNHSSFLFLQNSSLHCFPTSVVIRLSSQCVRHYILNTNIIRQQYTLGIVCVCVWLLCYCPDFCEDSFCLPSWNNHHRAEDECVYVCDCVCCLVFKTHMILCFHLTLILLIAATISIRLLGLGTSRLPTYCSKQTHTTNEEHQNVKYCPTVQLHD